MAIIDISWRPSRPATFGPGYSRRRRRVARVITDDEATTGTQIAYALGISIGDPHVDHLGGDYDPLCLCSQVDPQPLDDDPLLWLVTYDYETQASAPQATPAQNDQPGEGGDADDPTQWQARVTRGYGRIQWPMEKAFDDENNLTVPVVNTAGHEYSPKPMMDVRYLIITHERIEATYDAAEHLNFGGAVNIGDWNGFDAEAVLLDDWTVDDEYIGTTLFYRHRRVFWIAPPLLGTWKLELLNAGFVDATGNAIKTQDAKSQVSSPWPLDIEGIGLTPTAVLSLEHIWNTYRRCQRLDFADLNITL
jgi:hypothetical protein